MLKQTMISASVLLAALPLPATAQDQEGGGRNIMIGVGVQSIPRYPGADESRVTFLPLVDTWREGGPMTVESPDEAFGFAVWGSRNRGISVGPALTFAPSREENDVPGLPKVGFGMEVGGFVDLWPAKSLRLRGELRQGIGAHKALTGDLAADLVWRQGNEGPILTVGPRLKWGSGKYNRAYFGVAQPGTAQLAPFEPGAGIYAVGATAGVRLPLGRTFGLYGYLGYDRLTGRAADSPITTSGRPDQYSAGLALTYRFKI
jgi:MipA family protein